MVRSAVYTAEGFQILFYLGGGASLKERAIAVFPMRNSELYVVQTDDKFRSHVLWRLETWARNANEDTENKWTPLLPEFLKDVWPYQRKTNSPAVSASLCHLVFSNEELFPELVEIILPRLAKIDVPNWRWYKARDFVKKYPRQTLDLLYAVLPDNVSTWPYGIGDIFASISGGEPTLITNEKFLELKRRWDSR